jgi:uncharacterized membrane protein
MALDASKKLYTLWSTGRSGAGLPSSGKAEFATECPLTVPAVVSRLESLMEAYLLDWANLLLRWVHVITAIAWIGSSFYFVFLDNNLVKPTSPTSWKKAWTARVWAVHGGGFYNPQKYMVAPKVVHRALHWFYWESYSTWLSGFALFTVLLPVQCAHLSDRQVADELVPRGRHISGAVAFLVAFWLIYDRICQWFGP